MVFLTIPEGPISTWDDKTEPVAHSHRPCCQRVGGGWRGTMKEGYGKQKAEQEMPDQISLLLQQEQLWPLNIQGNKGARVTKKPVYQEGCWEMSWTWPRHLDVRGQLKALSGKRSFWMIEAPSLCFPTLGYMSITESTCLKSWSWILLLEFLSMEWEPGICFISLFIFKAGHWWFRCMNHGWETELRSTGRSFFS